MRPSFWPSLLSYFTEVPVEDVSSYVNPQLYVILSKGRYQLATRNAIYSFGDLYQNYSKAFQKIKWETLTGKEMLLLGFGLGSIPYMLETKFHQPFRYTGVEADEQVIYLANKYVLDELKSPVEMHHADAIEFVKKATRKWDVICIDLFIDDEIPAGAQTREFLANLQRICTPDGLIMYNSLARTKDDLEKSLIFLHEVFLHTFPDGEIIDTKGNWILVNDMKFFEKDIFYI